MAMLSSCDTGAHYLVALPNRRTYYKFKGKAHSSEHLLRFLNMVCNQHDDKTWTLSNARSISTGQGGGLGGLASGRSILDMGVLAGVAVVLGIVGFAVRQRAIELQQVRAHTHTHAHKHTQTCSAQHN